MNPVEPIGAAVILGGPWRVDLDLLTDHIEIFEQFSDNVALKKWHGGAVFSETDASPKAERALA
ncbi:MAG: hypothetical protein ACR2PL_18825 [Dehalococcoidia bacterium]